MLASTVIVVSAHVNSVVAGVAISAVGLLMFCVITIDVTSVHPLSPSLQDASPRPHC